MKVLVNSYLNFAQNTAGGVYSKVCNFIKSSHDFPEYIIKPFDIWEDKIRDYDIVHYFALILRLRFIVYIPMRISVRICFLWRMQLLLRPKKRKIL